MKLLEKSQVNNLKQSEQKAIIDSGVNLAKKIDILRQELPILEKQRSDFISKSRIELEQSIKDLKDIKDTLSTEIVSQKKVLEKLREPLDKEWNKIKKEKIYLSDERNKTDIYLKELVEKLKVSENDRIYISISKKKVIEIENETQKLFEKSKKNESDTRIALEKVTYLKEIKETELYNREVENETKEKDLIKREKQLIQDIENLNKEKKKLQLKKQRMN